MSYTITHSVVSGAAANPAYDVDGPAWDANHSISGSITAAEITSGAALTKTDDTNVTLTLAGAPTTALLAATSVTVGWTGTLASGRLNSNVVQSVVNDTNVTGSIAAQALTLGWTGTLAAGRGGFGADVSASSGVPLFATGTATFTGTSGTGNFVRVDTPTLTTPVIGAATGTSVALTGASTIYNATAIPAGGTAGTGYKFSSTSNYGIFFGSGVPTLSAAQGSIYLRSDGTPYYNTNGTTGWTAIGAGGAGDFVGPASSTDNAAVRFDSTTGKLGQNSALIIADTTGSLSRSGGGGVPLEGTNTNDSASAGYVGELIGSTIASGSAVSMTTATNANITSISLTAGDWDVWGAITYNYAATTNVTTQLSSISSTSATLDNTQGNYFVWRFGASGLVPTAEAGGFSIGPVRKSLTGTTTIYLVGRTDFTVSTASGYGRLWARRVR